MLQVIEEDGVFMLAEVVKTLVRTNRKIVKHPSRGKGGGGHKVVHQNQVWDKQVRPLAGKSWKTLRGATQALVKAQEASDTK